MTLIKSTSGIRGTIGGRPGLGLTPFDIVKYTAAFGQWTIEKTGISRIVIGRDARASGEMVHSLVVSTLLGLGIDVTDLGLSATPTVAMAVTAEKAGGGIVLSASHYPKEWNGVKLLNQKGEVMSTADGTRIGGLVGNGAVNFSDAHRLGKVVSNDTYLTRHIEAIRQLPVVDKAAIKAANFLIAVDGVNSVGGIAVPQLLHALGVQTIFPIFCEPDGDFGHDPELIPEHLFQLSALVTAKKADMGIAVDPDVNRLFFCCEDGLPFGDDYLLVAIADHVLKHTPGNVVGSSTRALCDMAEKSGFNCFSASAGEPFVIEEMKICHAVVGGEGRGGVIYPGLHYGRDALVAIALFLSHVAKAGKSLSQLRGECPPYYMSKSRIDLHDPTVVEKLLATILEKYESSHRREEDGLRIDFEEGWVRLRYAGPESPLWIYTEAGTQKDADRLALRFKNEAEELLGRGKGRFRTAYK
ncbi:MAG TPA: hypothetical protein VNU70_06385 [Puia sp.]|nr:hypothetical protein [Puia sp.]